MELIDEEKWRAVVDCDSKYDGIFYYGVKTTGIVCRPSCKSKEPKRNNVLFFDNIEDAYAIGLRPCKRCRPELIEFNPIADLAKKTKHIYDTYYADRGNLLLQISKLSISQNHLINIFREQYNMTPVEYVNKVRIEKAKELLTGSEYNILNIAFQCGFGSLSTFYEFFKKEVGFPPKEYRKINGLLKESS
ncbi:Ada metal-binding domain-containing protein [Clostridium sp. OS1-26]|uniref:bifunctional transcriptional activator/DNA repair enzyme AdaA n=1 Tax=Clostridium sp. OS1-26 TaxID=3070681 RepID=UPI0027E19E48|nr:Ada metal-binding domain-containing protein [Clostridium sp. OS1-26]WML34540.1 Ada metal-binding domain-containing protein [Clostridium sp. OS1-26]